MLKMNDEIWSTVLKRSLMVWQVAFMGLQPEALDSFMNPTDNFDDGNYIEFQLMHSHILFMQRVHYWQIDHC